MGLEALAAAAGGFKDITGGLTDIFGSSGSTSGNSNTSGTSSGSASGSNKVSGVNTEGLEIDEEGINKLLKDMLGSTQGLASVFSGDKISGLYGSTVSKQASGNLLANLAGEIAKLKAKKVSTTNQDSSQTQTQSASQNSNTVAEENKETGGLLGQVGAIFGF